ncbi:hypothetical protein [Dactylosporangium sp. NPDC005555]
MTDVQVAAVETTPMTDDERADAVHALAVLIAKYEHRRNRCQAD